MITLRILLALALLPVAPLSAAIVTTNSSVRPTDNVLVENASNEVSGFSIRWRDSGEDTDGGQTFLVSGALEAYTLQAITVRVGSGQTGSLNPNAPGLPLVFDFFEYDLDSSLLTPLFRETAILPAGTQQGDFITFDLAPLDIELETGRSYAFMIGSNQEDTSGAAEDNRFRLASSSSDVVPNGFEIRREYEFGATRAALADQPNFLNTARDLLFIVHAIPEPSTGFILLAAAGLALGLRRR